MDAHTLVDTARALAPTLRERARRTEQEREVPAATIKELREAGLFRALQPKRYGGHELPPTAFYDAAIELGAACGSTGWVYGVVGVHAWQLALFPAETQDEVWGEDTAVLASSSYAPTGIVEPVDGGYRIRGRWSFSSGCAHCTWALLGGIVVKDGIPDHYTFLVPASDYAIDDVWHVAGLAGTGSNDVVIEDAFVPERRAQPTASRIGGAGVYASPLYQLPFASVFSNAITAATLGIAVGAVDAYRAHTLGRVRASNGEKAAADPFAQLRLAEAAGEIDDARVQLRRNMEELLALAEAGREIPMELRTRVRRDQVRGSRAALQATDRVFEAAGGRALFLDQPIQRAWRDVHAARVHAINDVERGLLVYGAHALGGAPPLGSMM
ncbi:MAG: acyl-CoA dehydrogenase family protein [Myxococcota bacterium]|nr:acyl-CoA dehydrogenase family protein [Myxococcales bacterium]